jgi:hypothetical protein
MHTANDASLSPYSVIKLNQCQRNISVPQFNHELSTPLYVDHRSTRFSNTGCSPA